MIIEEIILHNYGLYNGRQKMFLAPPSIEKPITLIGGLNGGGKTTLLDALQLALYGKRARLSSKNNLSYEEYLRRSINRSVPPAEGAAVEIQFVQHSAGEEKTYRIHRSWRDSNGTVTERVQVLINGVYDRVITETWNDVIEGFIPVSLSHLFFFDGEKIEGFADLENSKQLLSKAVHSLLGLDIVDRLNTDLSVFENKQRIKLKSNVDKKRLEELEAEIEKIEDVRSEYFNNKAAKKTEIDHLENRLRQLEEKYIAEGGLLLEERQNIDKEKINTELQLREIENQLIEKAAGAAPLFLVEDLLVQAKTQVDKENHAKQNALLGEVLSQRDSNVLSLLEQRNTDVSFVELLKRLFDDDRSKRNEDIATDCYLNVSENTSIILQNLINPSNVEEKKVEIKNLIDLAEEFHSKIFDLDRKLASVPDPESLKPLTEAIRDFKDLIQSEKINLAAIELEENRLIRERDQKKSVYLNEAEGVLEIKLEHEDVNRILTHSNKVRQAIEVFRQKVVEKRVTQIEKLIFESYTQLLRKKSLISDLKIDTTDFSLELRGYDGELLSPEILSAGERQLLAVSMLWGLARASGLPLPAIIDTPLGRLDATHRLNLVEKYFPNASHQVLLLSTDEEIDSDLYEKLNPWIGHTYTLDFDDAVGRTTINTGYFDFIDNEILEESNSNIQLAFQQFAN